jgi:hypothetical protein
MFSREILPMKSHFLTNLKFARPLAFVVLLGASSALAAEPMIYPSKGQTPQQLEKDKFECYQWAKKQTGIDPMAMNPAPPPAQTNPGRGKAVKGAAVGAGVGAIAGNAGTGAAIGAGAGAVGHHRAGKKQQQAQQAGQAQKSDAVGTFNKANATCLTGRGYSVS